MSVGQTQSVVVILSVTLQGYVSVGPTMYHHVDWTVKEDRATQGALSMMILSLKVTLQCSDVEWNIYIQYTHILLGMQVHFVVTTYPGNLELWVSLQAFLYHQIF